jgi:hypothetical protein
MKSLSGAEMLVIIKNKMEKSKLREKELIKIIGRLNHFLLDKIFNYV